MITFNETLLILALASIVLSSVAIASLVFDRIDRFRVADAIKEREGLLKDALETMTKAHNDFTLQQVSTAQQLENHEYRIAALAQSAAPKSPPFMHRGQI